MGFRFEKCSFVGCDQAIGSGGADPTNSFVFNNCSYVKVARLPENTMIEFDAHEGPLFRFLPEPYASEFIRGRIRLSPVHTYRDIPCVSRRDQTDGAPREPVSVGEFMQSSSSSHVEHVSGAGNEVAWTTPLCLALALSRYPFAPLCQKFADAATGEPSKCIEIHEPRALILRIDEAVRAAMKARGESISSAKAAEIMYFEPFVFGPKGPPTYPALVKPRSRQLEIGTNEYWIEAEYRALWQIGVIRAPLTHLQVDVGDVSAFARLLEEFEFMPATARERIVVRPSLYYE